MGSAHASNSASAVANVANFINNSTTANSAAVNIVEQHTDINNCKIKLSGDFNVHDSAVLVQKNNQIIAAKQDANVSNNIAQALLQQAQSTVGTLGIGFADANNSASEMVNDTNQIINAMTVGCGQYSSVDQSFTCQNSNITAKNLNIGFSSSSDFLSTQTLNNDQVANVVNDISQTIQQKATATVEGIAGMLIMILLGIAVIIYVAAKPLSSGGGKLAVGVSLCFVIVGILIVMYLRGNPPFFSSMNECINNSSVGMGETSSCINTQRKKIYLAHPPIKYIYGITPLDTSQPGSNLVQMVIAANSGQDISTGSGSNGGYRGDTYKALEQVLNQGTPGGPTDYNGFASKLGIPMIPNPLYLPSPDGKTYYKVPPEFSPVDPDKDNNSICTPATIQVGDTTSPSSLKNCPQIAAPSAFTTITNPGVDDWPNIVANLSIDEWSNYINMKGTYAKGIKGYKDNDEGMIRALFARFVLCDILNTTSLDLHHYVTGMEYVKYRDSNNILQVGLAKDMNPNEIYLYHPYSFPGSWSSGIVGPGYIMGQVGVVNDSSYRFQNFMKKSGGWIMIAILFGIFAFMFYIWWKNKN